MTLPICKAVMDEAARASEAEIAAAMRLIAEHASHVVEGAAGVALAGLMKSAKGFAGKTVAVVLCGGNIELEMFERAKGLRLPPV